AWLRRRHNYRRGRDNPLDKSKTGEANNHSREVPRFGRLRSAAVSKSSRYSPSYILTVHDVRCCLERTVLPPAELARVSALQKCQNLHRASLFLPPDLAEAFASSGIPSPSINDAPLRTDLR